MRYLAMYIGTILRALNSLRKGMRLTGYYFTHHKEIVTQQYPDNRATLKLGERFRGEVVLTHDENNEHRCTARSLARMVPFALSASLKWTRKHRKRKKQLMSLYIIWGCVRSATCVLWLVQRMP